MDRFMFLSKGLRAIQDGSMFSIVLGWLVRVCGVSMAVLLIVDSVTLWKPVLDSRHLTAQLMTMAIVGEVLIILVCYVLFNILWLRGSDMLELKRDNDYNVTPIFVLLIKTVFESMAVLAIASGLLGGLSLWLEARIPALFPSPVDVGFLAFFAGNNAFLRGLTQIVAGPVAAFLLILLGYFLAETLGALVSIARNTKKSR